MTTVAFLSYLKELGIMVWMDGDILRFTAPQGAMTASLREELTGRKAEIVQYLRETHHMDGDRPVPPSFDDKGPSNERTVVAPHTLVEKTLARIWAQVLGIEQVGINENFFAIGGDSLLAMRVITLARQEGLQFLPFQMMQRQTIAELAQVEGAVDVEINEDLVTGAVPLTTGQHWFFDQKFIDLNRFNLAGLFVVDPDLNPLFLKQTVQQISIHHDALRARYKTVGSDWQQYIEAPGDDIPFDYIDFSGLTETGQRAAIEIAADQLQNSLSLAGGPVFRVAFINLGKGKPGRLLVILHHVVGDDFSINILLEDIELAYKQLDRGEEIHLPAKTASIKKWAEQLNAFAQSVGLRQELDYWLQLPWSTVCPLPLDYPASMADNTQLSRRSIRVSLNACETRVLLRDIPALCGASVTEVLLMAMVDALAGWTGDDYLPVSVVDSGRGSVPGTENLDVSRTIGWLASTRILVLARKEAKNPLEALASVVEQCRHVPGRGFGCEILYFCNRAPEIVKALEPHIKQEVKLFYNGQQRKELDQEQTFLRRAPENAGKIQNPLNREYEPLLCVSYIKNECLVANWIYSQNLHSRTTIEAVAHDFIKSIRELTGYCQGL